MELCSNPPTLYVHGIRTGYSGPDHAFLIWCDFEFRYHFRIVAVNESYTTRGFSVIAAASRHRQLLVFILVGSSSSLDWQYPRLQESRGRRRLGLFDSSTTNSHNKSHKSHNDNNNNAGPVTT
jgi:hypothetical protein